MIKMKKGDLIIILILIVAAVSWFGINRMTASNDARQVVIEVDGSVYSTLLLTEGMKEQDTHIELKNGNYIDIAVNEEGAFVKDVICPDKICQKTGVVSKVGQTIVCLPNKVVVYVEGKAQSEVDDVSF